MTLNLFGINRYTKPYRIKDLTAWFNASTFKLREKTSSAREQPSLKT